MSNTTMTDLQIPAIPLNQISEGMATTIREFQKIASKGKPFLTPIDELPPGVRVMILANIDFFKKDDELLKLTDIDERNRKRKELFDTHPFNDNSQEWPWNDEERLGKILKWMQDHP